MVPTKFVLLSRVIVGIKLHRPCFCILPPCRTPPCKGAFQYRQYRMSTHGSPHTFGNCIRKKEQPHLLPVNVSSSCFLNLTKPSFPAFDSVPRSLCSKTNCRSQNRIHCRLAPPFFCISHSPRYVFASGDLRVSPPGLVRTLHLVIQTFVRFARRIENLHPRILKLCSEENLCRPSVA